MKKKSCKISTLIVLILWSLLAQSQQRTISLEELFRLADENSKSISAYRIGIDAAEENAQNARSERLPSIEASLSLSYLGNGYIWDRDFSNGMSIDIPHFGNNFSLSVAQVIYAGGSISHAVDLSNLGRQIAELDFNKNRQEIHFLLTGYYLDIYKMSNQVKVFTENINLTEKLIQDVENKRDQGVALKNDVTRYELQLQNLKLQRTRLENAKKILNVQLVNAIGLDKNVEIIPDSNLLINELTPISEEEWQKSATSSSFLLQQAELGIMMNRKKESLERAGILPQVALIAENHLDGPVTIEVPALDNNFNYWFIGVGVKYDFSSLYKHNHKVRQAKLNTARSLEEQAFLMQNISTAVQAAFIQYNEAVSNMQTYEKTLELATINYEMTNNRYENDLALLTDMIDAANVKLSAELDLENARINVIYCYYKLKYICGII